MILSFAVPAMAMEVKEIELTSTVEWQEITPHTEMTRIYWRNYGGQIQWRVWSITNGRWMTEWTDLNPI